jgi:hypothetical protein
MNLQAEGAASDPLGCHTPQKGWDPPENDLLHVWDLGELSKVTPPSQSLSSFISATTTSGSNFCTGAARAVALASDPVACWWVSKSWFPAQHHQSLLPGRNGQ